MSKHQVKRLVLTGGPCGGKTSAIPFLEKKLTALGYKVLILPEAATEINRSGVQFNDCTVLEFQTLVTKRMLYYEQEALEMASLYPEKNIILLSDRGFRDNKEYMSDKDYQILLSSFGLTDEEVLCRYDAVFHLITAALGAEKFYKLEGARHETPEEARELDVKTLQAWLHHPKHIIIDNSTNFDEKMNRLLNKILEIVG